jgi:hypothetical protein
MREFWWSRWLAKMSEILQDLTGRHLAMLRRLRGGAEKAYAIDDKLARSSPATKSTLYHRLSRCLMSCKSLVSSGVRSHSYS